MVLSALGVEALLCHHGLFRAERGLLRPPGQRAGAGGVGEQPLAGVGRGRRLGRAFP